MLLKFSDDVYISCFKLLSHHIMFVFFGYDEYPNSNLSLKDIKSSYYKGF